MLGHVRFVKPEDDKLKLRCALPRLVCGATGLLPFTSSESIIVAYNNVWPKKPRFARPNNTSSMLGNGLCKTFSIDDIVAPHIDSLLYKLQRKDVEEY